MRPLRLPWIRQCTRFNVIIGGSCQSSCCFEISFSITVVVFDAGGATDHSHGHMIHVLIDNSYPRATCAKVSDVKSLGFLILLVLI